MGYWRLCTPDGQRFGHRVWVDVIVRDVPQAEPAPAPAPAPAPVNEPMAEEPQQPVAPAHTFTDLLELEFEQMNMSKATEQPEAPLEYPFYQLVFFLISNMRTKLTSPRWSCTYTEKADFNFVTSAPLRVG